MTYLVVSSHFIVCYPLSCGFGAAAQSFGVNGMVGVMRPFSLLRRGLGRPAGAGPAISIVDRFFLGGPLALRGYGPYAVGPRDSRMCVGCVGCGRATN